MTNGHELESASVLRASLGDEMCIRDPTVFMMGFGGSDVLGETVGDMCWMDGFDIASV